MTRSDEEQEAIARVRTAVNLYDELRLRAIQALNATDGDKQPVSVVSEEHWSLGSLLARTLVRTYEMNAGKPGFLHFERRLGNFLSAHIECDERPPEPLEVR